MGKGLLSKSLHPGRGWPATGPGSLGVPCQSRITANASGSLETLARGSPVCNTDPMADPNPLPSKSSLRTFASAALRLALNFVEQLDAESCQDNGEKLSTLLGRREWQDFGFASTTGEKLHVAIVPDSVYQGAMGKLFEMAGVKTLAPASIALVATLDEVPEAG